MKVLVSTLETQNQRVSDFCHVPEGELVRFGSECDRGSVDDHCGCRRSMSGLECRKATTTLKVADRPDLTPERLEEAVMASLVSGGWGNSDDPETQAWAREDAKELSPGQPGCLNSLRRGGKRTSSLWNGNRGDP